MNMMMSAKDEQVKDNRQKFLVEFKVLYSEEQKPIIDRFVDYCRVRGYNRVAGLVTLLEMADYHKSMISLAQEITDLTKEVEMLKAKPVEPPNEADNRPKTMGQGNSTLPVK